MRKARVFVDGHLAGQLQEIEKGKQYSFEYLPTYKGPSVSLEMPLSQLVYIYDRFPPFFEGLLPEGIMLDGLLRQTKIDRDDLMSQLIAVGQDVVGNVTIEASE